jgi:hypothetical protein
MDVAAELRARPEVAWALLADTSRWPEWGPSVTGVRAPRRHVEPGLRGSVRTLAGVWLSFEITEVVPGRAWRWRVAGIAATGHRVEPVDGGRCRVVFEVPAWAAPYALVCRLALRRLSRLAG